MKEFDYKPDLKNLFGFMLNAKSIWPAIAGGLAAGAAGSLLGGGGGKTKIKRLDPYAGSTKDMAKLAGMAMPGAAEALQMAGEPPPIQKTAPMSGVEQMAYGGLEDYMTSPLPSEAPLYQAGRGEIEKTLAGDYDPVGSTYYQAYRTAVMRELQEAKDRLAASTSARDKYFGGGRIETTGELEESAMGDLAMVLGQLTERERERKLGVAPMAIEEAIRESRLPAERAEIGLGLGGLPRQLEELGFTREHAAYLQEMKNLNIPLETAIALMTSKPEYTAQQQGGGLMDILPALALMAGMGGFGGGGGGGTTTPYKADYLGGYAGGF